METALRILGDGLSIAALTIIATTAQGLEAVMVFCVRATLGAVLAMAQLFHLRSVIKTLQDEGQL